MIRMKINGGLGNQMFQYAAAKNLALSKKIPLSLDIQSYDKYPDRQYDLNIFPNIHETFTSKLTHKFYNSKSFIYKFLRALLNKNIYKEPHFHFDPSFSNITRDCYINGYFQSELYFEPHANEIRRLFEFNISSLSKNTKHYLEQIKQVNSISIHFRRGDYVSNEKANQVHGLCDLDYYRRAVEQISTEISDCTFFVFSDDISWVKEQDVFKDIEVLFIQKTSDMKDYEEMFLMSQCDHNIIANSSFSWWAAWLNKNPNKKVIAPEQWFKDKSLDTRDLIPTKWLKI